MTSLNIPRSVALLIGAATALAAMPAGAQTPAPSQAGAERLQRYGDVLNQLVSEMVACSPEGWTSGRLSIQFDGARLTYQLRNPGHPERAELSPELIALIDELAVRMIRDGAAWREASIGFTRTGENVSFDASFDYVDG